MRIAHVADIHIRNFKFRTEYKLAFDNLYRTLDHLKPDLIVNCGDTVHSKLSVSPELFDDVADHIRQMSSIAEYWITLGNHDLNLKNRSRTDAISPIIRALHPVNARLLPNGLIDRRHDLTFWNFDIREEAHTFVVNEDETNVGFFHGSISGAGTDLGFLLAGGESVAKFSSMDYMLLGDIHKRQSFRGGTMWYPGSLIQQNYGEELVKGFLLWDIRGKDDFSVTFNQIETTGRFFTFQVPQSLELPDINIPQRSRIRAIVGSDTTPSQRWELSKAVDARFKPLEFICSDSAAARDSSTATTELISSDSLMRGWLESRDLRLTDPVVQLFQERAATFDDDRTIGTTWRIKKFGWSNMLNYGEDNVVDLSRVPGLVGIFAPNAAGKSSIFDILLESLFDKISKDVPRNIDLVNDNKTVGKMIVEVESGEKDYTIERTIERISYGQRKLKEIKQWGKTTLDFSDSDHSLNGTSRPETERAIRRVIGTFDDFTMTSIITQNPIYGLPGGGDIINCKETDRRKILFKFLNLDVYDHVHKLTQERLKELTVVANGASKERLFKERNDLIREIDDMNRALAVSRDILDGFDSKISIVRDKLLLIGDRESRKRRAVLKSSIERKRVILDELRSALDLCAEEIVSHDQQIVETPSIPLNDLIARIAERRVVGDDINGTFIKKNERLERANRAIKIIDGIPCGTQYPNCKFIADAVVLCDERNSIADDVRRLLEERSAFVDEMKDLEAMEVRHRDYGLWERKSADLRSKNEQLTRDLIRVENEIGALMNELLSLDDLVDDSTLYAEERALIDGKNVELKESERILRSLGAHDSKLDELDRTIEGLEALGDELAANDLLLQMTGKNGLPYTILGMMLPAINAEIAKILSGIVKFSVFFEDDPETQTVSLYIRYGNYKSRPLGLGSGAEKFIASLAIRVALLNVSSLPKTDTLIVDEGFGKLDPEHLESLQRMLEYLRTAFRSVFVVSHLDFMKDIVDHSIEITSKNGYASVEVI